MLGSYQIETKGLKLFVWQYTDKKLGPCKKNKKWLFNHPTNLPYIQKEDKKRANKIFYGAYA